MRKATIKYYTTKGFGAVEGVLPLTIPKETAIELLGDFVKTSKASSQVEQLLAIMTEIQGQGKVSFWDIELKEE